MNLILEMSPQLSPARELLEGEARLPSQPSPELKGQLPELLQLLFPRHVALTSPTLSRTLLSDHPYSLVNFNVGKKTSKAQALAMSFPDLPPHFQKSGSPYAWVQISGSPPTYTSRSVLDDFLLPSI